MIFAIVGIYLVLSLRWSLSINHPIADRVIKTVLSYPGIITCGNYFDPLRNANAIPTCLVASAYLVYFHVYTCILSQSHP